MTDGKLLAITNFFSVAYGVVCLATPFLCIAAAIYSLAAWSTHEEKKDLCSSFSTSMPEYEECIK